MAVKGLVMTGISRMAHSAWRIAFQFFSICAVLHALIVSPAWAVEVGEPMPDFIVQTLDGNRFSRADLAGKPAILFFWNTWCTVCKGELPKINKIAERSVPGSVAILAINTGLNDSENKARAYWKKYGYVFPAGFDRSFEIGKAFKVRGVPTVILVDAKGTVRYKNSLPPQDIEERIKKLGK